MTDIKEILKAEREYLLDLSTRTRLLNTPRRSKRSKLVEVVDELSNEVFRILVKDGQSMSFLPVYEEPKQEDQDFPGLMLPQPEDEVDEDGIAKRHKDTKLQTELDPSKLQQRLRQLHVDSKTAEQEQGVNILYLALGFLNWKDPKKQNRHYAAPLILLPVSLERKSARARFKVSFSGEELITNISLQLKLEKEWGVVLPDLPEIDDLIPSDYMAKVADKIPRVDGWSVECDGMVLGLFSFAKFLMYRDLDEANWPAGSKITDHELLGTLLGDGFPESDPLWGADEFVDRIVDPKKAFHVLDADSSQTLAIEEIRKGHDLVIQGPPGTGKSQTIANVISTAVKEGKRVLFLAEKRAALDVVKRRFDNIGLGDMCFELHSHKAKKKQVLADLGRTLATGKPKLNSVESTIAALRRARDLLNSHAKALNTPIASSGVTPVYAMGKLLELKRAGFEKSEFDLDVADMTRGQLESLQLTVRTFQDHAEAVGSPEDHPWRGTTRGALLPQDVTRVVEVASEFGKVLAEFLKILRSINDITRFGCESLEAVEELLRWCDWVERWPGGDVQSITNDCWLANTSDVDDLISSIERLISLRTRLIAQFHDDAWKEDLGSIRRTLASYEGSRLRWFHRDYRAAQRSLKGYAGVNLPSKLHEQIRVLGDLEDAKRLLGELDAATELGTEAFGTEWKGYRSNARQLRDISHWVRSESWEFLSDSLGAASRGIGETTIRTGAQVMRGLLAPLRSHFADIQRKLELDIDEAFGCAKLELADLELLQNRLEQWISGSAALSGWITYHAQCRKLERAGLQGLVELIDQGRWDASAAYNLFQSAYYEQLIRHAWEANSELAHFSGITHSQILEDFRELDTKRIELARSEVALAHWDSIPRGTSKAGEIGIIQSETQKKSRHLSIRSLLERAGRALQACKPVFMMSPMSIAQFLKPGAVEFDLLVVDEASQIRPVDALGAIARAKQLVVVGDDKQLPPTRFFASLILDTDEVSKSPEEERTGDFESILKLCNARGVPSRMLRWHYRSKHEALIAVSNRYFYDNRLFIVPSPEVGTATGLKFHYQEDAVYDRGRTARNENEADAVVRAVIEHAVNRPDVSLGVVAFSVQQRDAILDFLELYRREHSETEEFFAEGSAEPFFVKNLESVQGDERDVMMISIGFGRDASGYMSMNFGPISQAGGERRLNVLITRARESCEIFSSIRHHDIDLARISEQGPKVLKAYLQFAETGNMDLGTVSGREADSPFEEEVAKAITDLGWDVDAQVGVAGFFIDLAVKDRANPGRYILGIECDGATYHSSRSARDRDRLRQQVLEDRGWKIHRIWSTDWFRDPDGQLREVLEKLQQVARPASSQAAPASVADIEREEQVDNEKLEAPRYIEASFDIPYQAPPDRIGPHALLELAKKVIEIEEPIHREELARRLTQLWRLGRTGKRIADAVEWSLSYGFENGTLKVTGDFLHLTDGPFEPRDRWSVESKTLKKPSMIPPVEIREGIVRVVQAHVGMTANEAAMAVVRLLGFERTGEGLRDIVEAEIRNCLGSGVIEIVGDQLRIASDA